MKIFRFNLNNLILSIIMYKIMMRNKEKRIIITRVMVADILICTEIDNNTHNNIAVQTKFRIMPDTKIYSSIFEINIKFIAQQMKKIIPINIGLVQLMTIKLIDTMSQKLMSIRWLIM